MRILESEKILLRHVTEEEDLEFLYELRMDSKICESIVGEFIKPKDQRKWFDKSENTLRFIIHNKQQPSLIPAIGFISLFDISQLHRRAKWNVRIHPDYHRKGFGRSAIMLLLDYVFNTMNINKLMGDCFADNEAEVSNLTKLGFRNEGVWKEHYFHKGKYRDSIQFVMLKSEYDKNKEAGLYK